MRPLRYIVHNRFQDIPASYNVSLGAKTAYAYALQNARWHAGEIVCEFVDGTTQIVWPSAKAQPAPKTV